MTKREFNDKMDELINGEYGVISSLKIEIDRLLKGGAVDPDKYIDDFVLLKIILTVALRNIADGYEPFSK